MPEQIVPATTKIRTRSLPHVPTERLIRRLCWFRDTDHRLWLEDLPNRRPMRDLAREMILVEEELVRRCDEGDPEAVAWAWTVSTTLTLDR